MLNPNADREGVGGSANLLVIPIYYIGFCINLTKLFDLVFIYRPRPKTIWG